MKIRKKFLVAFFIFLLLPQITSAVSHEIQLPDFLAESQQQALENVKNMSFLIAFLGGMLMLFAPCSFALLPAFFALSFKEKRKLGLMTFVFFLGFALIFALMGIGASFIGSWLNLNQSSLVFGVGILLVIFGILSLFGKRIPIPTINKNPKKDIFGVFTFGIFFAVGYAGCAGPILLGILTLASILPTTSAVLMMFIYSLGLAVPLILLSYFFDRYNLFGSRLFKMRIVKLNLLGKKLEIITTNLIAGLLFIFIGSLFILYRTTASLIPSVNAFLGSIYSINYGLQERLISTNVPYANIILILLLGLLILFILKSYLYKKY